MSWFAVALFVSCVTLFAWHRLERAETVEGVLQFDVRGATTRQFSTARPFDTDGSFNSSVLESAVRSVQLDSTRFSAFTLRRSLAVEPMIPDAVLDSWRRQDADGETRQEYHPTHFTIHMKIGGLDAEQRLRLFTAIIESYLETIRSGESGALTESQFETARALESGVRITLSEGPRLVSTVPERTGLAIVLALASSLISSVLLVGARDVLDAVVRLWPVESA